MNEDQTQAGGTQKAIPTSNVRTFAPEYWGQVDRFANLYSGTFTFGTDTRKAVGGTGAHFNKAVTFRALAEKLRPNLEIDEHELETRGHTPALNSAEVSAVVEVIFLELYSSIDCARKVISAVYANCRGLPTGSTRKMFRTVRDGAVGPEFPNALKAAFKSANWFDDLRTIRDELTHLTVGHCHLSRESGLVSYIHGGIQRSGKPLVIDDIFWRVDELIAGVNGFLGHVFMHLNSLLADKPVHQMCGVFSNRAYMRLVVPRGTIDLHSGQCVSHTWFDLPINPRCPLADTCGAYSRAKTERS